MKALVVYESIFGNTKRVAEAIGAGLRAHAEVEVREVAAAPAAPVGVDLLVVGGPTHAWGMSRAGTRDSAREQAAEKQIEPPSESIGVREWLGALSPGEDLAAVAFDTAIRSTWLPVGSAARHIARRLAALGFHAVARPEQFRVGDVSGPLLDGELERARAWGEGLAAEVAEVAV